MKMSLVNLLEISYGSSFFETLWSSHRVDCEVCNTSVWIIGKTITIYESPREEFCVSFAPYQNPQLSKDGFK